MFEQSWTGVLQNTDTTRATPTFIGETFPRCLDSPEHDNYPKIKKHINVPFTAEVIDTCVSVTETCGQLTVPINEDLLDIIEVSIDEIMARQGRLFFDLAQKVEMEKENAEQLRTDILDSIESEISKNGLQLTDEAKQIFLDTLLVVMKKTDEYLKENQ